MSINSNLHSPNSCFAGLGIVIFNPDFKLESPVALKKKKKKPAILDSTLNFKLNNLWGWGLDMYIFKSSLGGSNV